MKFNPYILGLKNILIPSPLGSGIDVITSRYGPRMDEQVKHFSWLIARP